MDGVTQLEEWVHEFANRLQSIVATIEVSDGNVEEHVLASLLLPRERLEELLAKGLVLEFLRVILSACHRNSSLLADPHRLLELLRSAVGTSPAVGAMQLYRLTHAGANQDACPLAQRIISYIHEHHPKRLTVASVADTLGISSRQLNSALKAATGQLFRELLTSTRLRHGLQLVAAGTKVEVAALSVGYRAKRGFYNSCKIKFGLTPIEASTRLLLEPAFVCLPDPQTASASGECVPSSGQKSKIALIGILLKGVDVLQTWSQSSLQILRNASINSATANACCPGSTSAIGLKLQVEPLGGAFE